MNRLRWPTCLLVALPIVFVAFGSQQIIAEVYKTHLRELEANFLPAWQRGDNLTVLTSLGKVVQKMSDEQVDELDDLFADQQMPNSAKILVEARMHLLQRGLDSRLPKPGLRELVLTLDNIDTEIQQVLEDVKLHSAELGNATDTETLAVYDALIWNSHVIGQKVESCITLTEYALLVLKAKHRHLKKALQPRQREILSIDFEAIGEKLAETKASLAEHETMVRIKRLKAAGNTLANSKNLKDRYLAVSGLRTDGPLVQATLEAGKGTFTNPELNNPGLLAEVALSVEKGVELAGESLMKKSGLLFTGLHWWMRGRYGMGSEACGFLKSAHAVTSDAALFPLYMPEETPVATSRYSQSEGIPEVDRRHNYIWEWEYRKLTFGRGDRKATAITSQRATSETQLSRFY